jgi:hypothetical protein
MGYELWDLDSGNLIGDFDDRAEALAHVREIVKADGPAAVDQLALQYVYDEGRSTDTVAEGKALLDLIRPKSPTC